MSRDNLLFFQESIDDQLRGRQRGLGELIDRIPQDQFLISSDAEIVAHVLAQQRVDPIVLHEESRDMRQEETKMDVSGDRMRMFMHDPYGRGPHYIAATRVTISIPFSGSAWLFRYRTNPFSTVFPRADITEPNRGRHGQLTLIVERPHDANPEEFKGAYESEMKQIREYVQRANAQAEAFNAQLPALIQSAMAQRRQRLDKHKNIAALLDIPVQTKDGAPPVQPVRIEVRSPPALPVPPKTGLRPEPGIAPETYEKILSVIRHEARTYETTPHTFAKFGEEELRDIILSHLNGHFQGAAAGEVFRKTGKTDIRIEEKDRAAFVGECKVWQGAGQIATAIDQLLNYLTWRDSKAALVIFNKSVKGFSSVIDKIPEAIQQHSCYVRASECQHQGEWRFTMRSIEDEGRLVTMHVFAINLYVDSKVNQPGIRRV